MEFVRQDLVFFDLSSSGMLESFEFVLKDDGYANDGDEAGRDIGDDEIWLELTAGTRNFLVFSDCPSNRRCSPGQPMDNVMVVESPRTTDVFTMAEIENMWESFKYIITAAALLTALSKSICSVEGHGIQPGSMEEAPVSKPGIKTGFHHMIRFTAKAGD